MEPSTIPTTIRAKTLLTSLDASQNVDRLQSLMARARGYVGVATSWLALQRLRAGACTGAAGDRQARPDLF